MAKKQDYTIKEVMEKFLGTFQDDYKKKIVLEVLNGKTLPEIAVKYGFSSLEIENFFREYVRKAYLEMAEGASADGTLTIDEIIEYLEQ